MIEDSKSHLIDMIVRKAATVRDILKQSQNEIEGYDL